MWLGCAYAAAATAAYFSNQLADRHLHSRRDVFMLLAEVVLTSSVWAALTVLWLFQALLVLRGHSSISLLQRGLGGGGEEGRGAGGHGGGGAKGGLDGWRGRWRRLRGALRWQGAAARWRRTFGASGRLWWLTWAVPPLRSLNPEDGLAWLADAGRVEAPGYPHV
jgi:hypothetical protein